MRNNDNDELKQTAKAETQPNEGRREPPRFNQEKLKRKARALGEQASPYLQVLVKKALRLFFSLRQSQAAQKLARAKERYDAHVAVPAFRRSAPQVLPLYRFECRSAAALLCAGFVLSAYYLYIIAGLIALCARFTYPHVCKVRAEKRFYQQLAAEPVQYLALPGLLHHFAENLPKLDQAAAEGRLPFTYWQDAEGAQLLAALREKVLLGSGFEWGSEHLTAFLQTYQKRRPSTFFDYPKGDLLQLLGRDTLGPVTMSTNELTTHTMIFGTTGTGKSTLLSLLITQALLRRECVIILDPKSDPALQSRVFDCCSMLGRENELKFLDLSQTLESIKLNALGHFTRTTELADRLTSTMPSQGSALSFKAYAQNAVNAAISLLLLEGKAVTIEAIREATAQHAMFRERLQNWLVNLVKSLNNDDADKFLKKLRWSENGKRFRARKAAEKEGGQSAPEPAEDRDSRSNTLIKIPLLCLLYSWLVEKGLTELNPHFYAAADLAAMEPGFYAKVTAALQPRLNQLTNTDLKATLSAEGGMTLPEIVRQGGVLYVSLACLTDSVLGSDVGKLIMADLRALAGQINAEKGENLARRIRGEPEKKEPPSPRVNIFIDEASEILDESTIQLLNKGRGSGIAMTLATQSAADLSARIGADGAQQAIANCNTQITLRIFDQASAREIASSFPQVPVEQEAANLSYQEDITEGILNYGGTSSVQMQQVSLVPPALLAALPDFAYAARLADGRIMLGKVPLLSPALAVHDLKKNK